MQEFESDCIVDRASLTKTQIEVAEFVVKGLDTKQIGERMFIQPHSVAFHVVALMRKFKVNSRYKLLCKLYEQGWR